MTIIESLESQWRQMNKRERNLALVTAVLLLLFLGWALVGGALSRLEDRRAQVDRLQEQVVGATYQISRKQQVEADYAIVAAQHSSAWDKYEVYERLRQEIFRLAQKVPPPLDENGVPVKATSDSGVLVNIPELRQGTMEETDKGYREYKISFRIPSVEITDLFNFLDRLQQSPQTLRIDGLTFARDWNATLVAADIDLTRIIVDGAAAGASADAAQRLTLTAVDLSPASWTAEDGALSPTAGGLLLEAQEDRSALYFEQSLPGASSYDCIVEVSSTGRGMLGIATAADGVPLPGAERLPDDGGVYRVHLRFTVPGESGQPVLMRVPYLTLNDYGTQLEVHRLELRRAEG